MIRRVAGWALCLGVTPVISSAYESGVGMAAVALAAVGDRPVPAGLDTYRTMAEDVLETPLATRPAVDVRETDDASRTTRFAGWRL